MNVYFQVHCISSGCRKKPKDEITVQTNTCCNPNYAEAYEAKRLVALLPVLCQKTNMCRQPKFHLIADINSTQGRDSMIWILIASSTFFPSWQSRTNSILAKVWFRFLHNILSKLHRVIFFYKTRQQTLELNTTKSFVIRKESYMKYKLELEIIFNLPWMESSVQKIMENDRFKSHRLQLPIHDQIGDN